ncbi:restriction endonuclease subunit S [Phocaeicola sp.]|uniref:restriction endonuclease subunit S n=1 Tax=Phocaeicola sp. TaxID=2773926 RepID=UPI003A8CF9E7
MENRYNKYKDSGIAWIGEIPEHWEITSFKRKITINNGKDYKNFLDAEIYPVMGSGGCFAYCSNYMYDGEALLLGRKGTIDKPLYVKGKFWAVDTMFYAIPHANLDCKFAYYLALMFPFNLYSTSTSLPSLTQTDLGNILVAFPFLSEQQSIAAHLDQKCGEINELITLQEEMITKLQSYKQSVITEAVTKGLDKNVPLKDRGIEWIGEIPEHWKVVKIKYLAKIKSGDSISSNEIVQEGIYEVYGGNGLMGYCNKKNVDGFNIIIGRVGALCGNVRLISESKYITDNALILNCFDNALYPYMYIMLKAANLNNLSTSNAQPLITGSKVLNVSLPIPPLPEQQSIADYLDEKCSEIDELISIKQQKIEKLKDYKKSLIFECVTGKRKV